MYLYLDRSFQQRPITEWVKFTSLKCMNMLLSNINISELSHYLVNHYYDHHVGITSAAEKGLKQMATMLSAMSSIFLQHKLSHFLASKK